MALGGIPFYLDQVEAGKSAIQNIDKICFHTKGALRNEFVNLYRSLFKHPERYEALIEALATKWKGLSRMEILEKTTMKDGGGLTSMLLELEQSGFISSYVPFNKKKKDTLYRLTDNYSLFYLKFIRSLPANESGKWDTLSQTQLWKSWSGYAFENICLQHVGKIKETLGISGVHTRQFSFLAKPTEFHEGTQIDLLIDRQDNSVSLCEVKFYNDEVQLSKDEAAKLRRKRSIFRQVSKTKKHIFVTLITTHDLLHNQHSIGLIDNVLNAESLF